MHKLNKKMLKEIFRNYIIPPKLWINLSKLSQYLLSKSRKNNKSKTQYPYAWRGRKFTNIKNVKYIPKDLESDVVGITRLGETKCAISFKANQMIELGPFPKNTKFICFGVTPSNEYYPVKDLTIILDGVEHAKIKGELVANSWQFFKLPIEKSQKIIKMSASWDGGEIYISIPFPEIISHNARSAQNIIVLVLDGLMTENVGCLMKHNIEDSNTPNIDKYFKNGRLFSNAYSQSEYTMPSLATMATGLYPIQHGVFTHDRAQRQMPLSIPTLAETMSKNGYRTMAYSTGNRFIPPYGHYRGFERFFLHQMTLTDNSDNIINRAIEFMEVHSEQPAFLFLHFIDPHPPFPLPTYFSDNCAGLLRWGDSRKLYSAFKLHKDSRALVDELRVVEKTMIRNVDFILSKLFAYLKYNDLNQNTNILLLADHGREYKKGDPLLSPSLTRIPLLINGPNVQSGYETGFVEAPLDLYPTIMDLAEISKPDHLAGKSALLSHPEYRKICCSESLFRRTGEIALRERNWFYGLRCNFDYMDGFFDFSNQQGEWLFPRNLENGVEDKSKNFIQTEDKIAEKFRKIAYQHYQSLTRYFDNNLIIEETRKYQE